MSDTFAVVGSSLGYEGKLVKGELIPKPQSSFIRVKCPKCGNEQVVFDRPSVAPRCSVCEEQLADPTGGKARIRSEVIQALG